MNKQTIITVNNMEWLVTTDSKTGVEKKRYCLEVDPAIWKPEHPGDICPEYMLRVCRSKGLADLEWYVNLLEEKITKEQKSKSNEVIKTIQRKRTPSEIRLEFIAKYFPDMKRVKEVDYQGHAAKAAKLLAEMKAAAGAAPAKKPAAKD